MIGRARTEEDAAMAYAFEPNGSNAREDRVGAPNASLEEDLALAAVRPRQEE